MPAPTSHPVRVLRAIQTKVKEHDEEMVMLVTRHYKPEAPLAKARVTAVMHWTGGNRRRDPGMVAEILKGSMDGLVKAGVLLDDSFNEIVEWRLSLVQCTPEECDFYVLIVEEVEA